MACVMVASTRVAITPPCITPLALRSSGLSAIRAVAHLGPKSTSSTPMCWKNAKSFANASSFALSFSGSFWLTAAPDSQELAQVRARLGRAHVEAGLAGDLEVRAGRIAAPLAAREPHLELTADHGHALGGIGAEVKLAAVDHAGGRAPPVALELDALNVPLEIAV